MGNLIRLLEFIIVDQQYALFLDSVDKVVRAVEVTPLPDAPQSVLGVIDVQGQILPVLNIRNRFGIPKKEIVLTDQLIIARAKRRMVVLLVDRVNGVIEHPEHEIFDTKKINPCMEYIEGIVKFKDGMILIHDLNKFLSLDEEKTLKNVMLE